VPTGVTVDLTGQTVKAKGKKGELSLVIPDEITVTREGNEVVVKPREMTKRHRMLWGTSRANLHNLIHGVSEGYTTNLEISGVGYRAAAEAKVLKLQLGYSHDIEYKIPAGIAIKTAKPTEIEITGANKQQVGQVAAEIRSMRGPEPYKGKGIKYAQEKIRRKEGKKK
ncbi:MAG: 50S ribosomal protein L6, partial [Rhodospirillales bacterium]